MCPTDSQMRMHVLDGQLAARKDKVNKMVPKAAVEDENVLDT